MKIAVTADNHLTTLAKNPERFQALVDILQQCGELDVQLLIIAGDLFDQSLANYAEFEDLYRNHRPDDLATVVIPGNHDQRLRQSTIAGDGLQIYSEPTIRPLNDSRLILFLPHQDRLTMGEAIAPFANQLAGKRWILVGHGTWTAGVNSSDPYEPGIYMPFTSADRQRYQPEIVFLGHIHLPQDSPGLYYPGSPCPLNVTETGQRRFLVFDTTEGDITPQLVNSPVIYFDEEIFMLPSKNDLEILKKDIKQRLESWGLPDGWEKRVQLRLKISGSALSDRQEILRAAKELFSPYNSYQNQGPDLSNLIHSRDPDRAEIAMQVQTWLGDLTLAENTDQPSKSLILEKALRLIYGISQ